jgi:galactose-1-phosphate uridylyltransferase
MMQFSEKINQGFSRIHYMFNNKKMSFNEIAEYFKEHEDMAVHHDMINYLREQTGDSKKLIQDYINNVCKEILECTAVFKNNVEGQTHLFKFLKDL